ncbi:UDP-N-acetylmuramoyl-L-alanine--D-glutamate ligase [Arthrobacter castelli]|uniref:UDP-N-acetylmuramoyl-L-alanine--D-glutamate ligase n=1 Tax=Arthrobacter castelli TaxID=271431 RepID=UPI0004786FAB|nr:UDP-N-acetylmuramoyl-L-alanine--D-glutamate ligase [Arthrobacter castelli]
MGGRTVNTARTDSLTSWDADWNGLRVVVAGIGVSGFSAADTLVELGADVVVVDAATDDESRAKADTLKIVGVSDVLLGAEHAQSLPDVSAGAPQLVVTSPGWKPAQPLLAAAASAGIPIWGDVELAWRLRNRQGRKPAEWLTVTGTNGKTTTVGLAESMLQASGLRAAAVGNVGTPVLDAIRDPEGFDVLVLELSSFQLHWSHTLSPLASVCLNVAEDHVDWHGSYAGYLADKAKIYANTRVAAVYNDEDAATQRMVAEADVVEGCRAIGFTTSSPDISMLGVVDDLLVDRAFIEDRHTSAAELAALGDFEHGAARHLVANALAAAALVRAAGVEPGAVAAGIRTYRPGEHRIQLVAHYAGVTWVNDSKATNPHAAEASLEAFKQVIWIAGGLPKGVEYDDLVARNAPRLKTVVLIGADTSRLKTALRRHAPDVPIIEALPGETEGEQPDTNGVAGSASGSNVMSAAVAAAADAAGDGDTVLMAPAAASMDQFPSYAHRGNAFIEAVREYVEGQAPTTKEL